MRTTRWLSAIALVLALPLLACQPAEEEPAEEEIAPAAELEEEAPAAGMVSETVAVTNNMPHPMVVYEVENGERTELGTVEADATETFTVEGQEGATVDLVAQDVAETHEVEQTVTVGGEPSTWSLGGG